MKVNVRLQPANRADLARYIGTASDADTPEHIADQFDLGQALIGGKIMTSHGERHWRLVVAREVYDQAEKAGLFKVKRARK